MSRILKCVDDFVEGIVGTRNQDSGSHDQPSDADLAAKEETFTLSLELFQLLALFLSFLVAVALVRFFAFLSHRRQSSDDDVPDKSARIINTPSAPTDSKSTRASGSVSSRIRRSLFPFLGKFHRFGACRRWYKPTRRSHPESGKRKTSSRAITTTATMSPGTDCSCLQQLGRLGKGETLVDQCKSEIVLRQSSLKPCCHSKLGHGSCVERFCNLKGSRDECGQPRSDCKDGIDVGVELYSDWKKRIDARGEPYSDRKDHVDARVKSFSDRKDHVDARGVPYSDRKDHVDARGVPYSDRKDHVDARGVPYSDRKDHVDARGVPYSDRKDHVDARGVPYSDRKDHVDARGVPYSDRKDHVDASGVPYSDRKDHVDARGEPYSDRKDHVDARVKSFSDKKDHVDARGVPYSDRKDHVDARAEPYSYRKDHVDARVVPYSDRKDHVDARGVPYSDRKEHVDARAEPYSDRKDHVDARVVPYSDRKDHVDARGMPYSDRKDHVDARVVPYSDRKDDVEARGVPYSDRKDHVEARGEAYYDWKGNVVARGEPYSDWKSNIVARGVPYSDWKSSIDARGVPYSNWKDSIDTSGVPYSDRKDHVDARGKPYSDRKDHVDARGKPYSDWRDSIESRDEPHSNCEMGRGSNAILQYNRKKSIESLVKPHCNLKNGAEPFADPHSSRSKGLECWAESNCGIKEDRDPCFQHHELETSEKIIANAPILWFERSRRNTDTNKASVKLKNKQSSQVEIQGNFHEKYMGLMNERLPNDYCNINSDEAVSDLLQGDLNSIINKYYKEPWVDNPELETLKVSMPTKQMAGPSCVQIHRRGLPVQTAVACNAPSKDTISSSTAKRKTCQSATHDCPSYQNKEVRICKNGNDLILKQSPERKKGTKGSNIHTAASKCTLMSLTWADSTVSGKQDIPLSQNVVPQKNESKQTNHINKQSTGLLHKTQQPDSKLEFFICDQHSFFSSQGQLSRCSVASQIERYAIRGSQESYSSDHFEEHSLSIIFPNSSTEAVINSPPHSEDFLSTPGNHSSIYEEADVVCSSKETLAEVVGSYCTPSKVYEDKRNTTYGKDVRSGKSFRRPGTSRLSSGDSAFVGRAVNAEEPSVRPVAPNTVLSSGRIKCLGTSKIQFPPSRNIKRPCKRDVGSNTKGACRKSIAVPKDICSVSHKNDTPQETAVKFPLFGKQQNQKTDTIFNFENCRYQQASNFVYGNRISGVEPFAHMRQVLAKNVVVTGSSNYDTDKQSILSQTDATSWSMNVQSRSSATDVLEDVHTIPSINTMNRLKPRLENHLPFGTHLTLASQEWTEVVLANGSSEPDYKTESKGSQQVTLKGIRYQDDEMRPKVKQSVDNNLMLNMGTFSENRHLTGKDNASQVGVNHQHRLQMDNVLRQEPFPKRSNTAIAKEARKRKSLIPRHIKTLSKSTGAKQDTTENAHKPPNTVLNGVNTIQSKVYTTPQDKRTFISAATKQLPLGETAKDKHNERNLVSESLKSGKDSRFEVTTGKKQSRFGMQYRGKQCISQTQTKRAISPAGSRCSNGGLNRKTRLLAKDTQDRFKPNAKCFGKKDLSSAMKNPGLVARKAKLYSLSSEQKKSNNAKRTTTASKNLNSQCKQTDAKNELKPPLLRNNESGDFTNVINGKGKEQNIDTDSNFSKDNNEDDMVKRSYVDDANHVQADPFHSNSVSEEMSLLTLTTLNYRLMSSSPIPQRMNQLDTQKRSSCEMDKDKQRNKLNYRSLKSETPEQITVGPKSGVVTLNACKTLRGKRAGSKRITQSEATPVHKFQAKGALKSFKSALDNAANGSQTEQSADLTDDNSHSGRSVRLTTNAVCGNITPQSDAMSPHNLQATYDLKPFKLALRDADQGWHVEKSTGHNDLNVCNAKAVQSAKNIMSRIDSTKTVPRKHGLSPACQDNSVRRCQTKKADPTDRKTFRDSSKKLWSELDCNKSNKIHNRTGEPRWNMERLCEVADDSCCSGTDKQKQTDKPKRNSTEERGFKSQPNQFCKMLSTFSPSNKIENPFLDLQSELCTAREKKHTMLVENAHDNQVPGRTETPNIDELIKEHCISSLLPKHDSAGDSEPASPCHQLLILPSCTPQLHNSGLCLQQINDEPQEREERRQFARERSKETTVKQQIGNAYTKCDSIQRRFHVRDNDKFADPVEKPRVGRKYKLNTRFFRNNKLPIHISQGNYTRVNNVHRNGVYKLTEEQPKQNQIYDRYKRLRNTLRTPPEIKTAPKEIGNCEARIKHSLAKTANIEQIKHENKYPYTVMKTNRVKLLPFKKHCKPIDKAVSAEKDAHVCTRIAEDNIRQDNGTLISDNGIPCKTTSQRLKVDKLGLSHSRLNVYKSGLENVLGDTRPSTIQIDENTDKLSDIKNRELETLKCATPDNVVLKQDGAGNIDNTQPATVSLIVNNCSKLDSAARSITQYKNVTGYNTTVCHGGHTQRNEEMQDHERTLSLSNNTPHRSNFSLCQKKRSSSGSLRSSRSKSSEAVGTASRVCTPVESVCSVLEINKSMGKPESRDEVECAGTKECGRTALVRGVGGEIHGSQFVDTSRIEGEAHCGNIQEQKYPNKQRHSGVSNATAKSELSEKSAYNSREVLNTEKVKYQPTRTEFLALAEYVSYVAKDYPFGALGYAERFNENEKDNEKAWIHENGPNYTQKVYDRCRSKTRCPDVKYRVPDLVMCPGGCNVGCPIRTNSSQEEQGRGHLQSSQARVHAGLLETDVRFEAMEGSQVTHSESKLLFSSNTSSDYTSTDSEDSSDFSSTWEENSPNKPLEPTETDSVNKWPKDSESTYASSLSQESELRCCHMFSNSDNYNATHISARKPTAADHHGLTKESKSNSTNRICANNALKSHKREPCLIKSPPLKLRRSQSSPDGRMLEILSTNNTMMTCLDQGRQSEKRSTCVSMCEDRKRTKNTADLVQGDNGRASAFGCFGGKISDGRASLRPQRGSSNKVSCVPVNLSQHLSEVDSGIQRQEIALRERRTAPDGKRACGRQGPCKSVSLNMPFNSIMQNRIKRIVNKRATQMEWGQQELSKGGTEIKKLTSKSLQLLSKNSNSWLWYNNPAENGNSDLGSNKEAINIPSPSRLPCQGIRVKEGSEWALETPQQRIKLL